MKSDQDQRFQMETKNSVQKINGEPPEGTGIPRRHATRKPSFFVEEGDLVIPLRIIGSDNEEILPEHIAEAPDGGWGWIVVFGSFMHNFIFGGTLFSFGVLLDAISGKVSTRSAFGDQSLIVGGSQISVTTIAWVGAILVACNRFTGPFAAALVNKFGFRVVAIAGSLISSLGLTASWFFSRDGVPNVHALFIFYGVVGGVGVGLLAMSSAIIVGFYFDKKRALATGIAVCGSGVGTCVFPVMLGLLIKQFGWPLTLLIQAGLFLSCVGFAVLYRPLDLTNHSLAKRAQVGSGDESIDSSDSEDVTQKSTDITNRMTLSSIITKNDLKTPSPPIEIIKTCANESFARDASDQPTEITFNNPENARPKFIRMKSLGYMGAGSNTSALENRILRKRISLAVPPKSSSVDIQEPRILRVKNKGIFNKPMNQDNIFYNGSIYQIKELPEDFTHMDLAFANSKFEEEMNEEVVSAKNKPEKKVWRQKLKAKLYVVGKMLSFDLMKSPTFFLLCLMCGLAAVGLLVPYVYLIGLAQDKGSNAKDATCLISVIGISDMIGRLICGFVANKVGNHVVFINNAALTIGGLATMAIPFFGSYTSLIIYACIFGLTNASVASLRSIILVDLIGLSKLTNAFGLTLFVEGIATLFGSPFAGFLRDSTGNYSVSFYAAGGFMLLAGIVCYPVYNVKTWEDRKRTESQGTKV